LEPFRKKIQRLFPIIFGVERFANTVSPEHATDPRLMVQTLMESNASGAKPAPADGIVLISLYIDNFSVFEVSQEAAANRAFPANSSD
jgi:hypothetical protein